MSRPIATIPPATHPVDARAPAAQPITAVAWDGGAAVIIDQRQLPDTLVHWRLSTVDAVVDAIRTLAVRGAPAIGIAGAYGVVTGLLALGDVARATALTELERLALRIGTARPTAVNLATAVARVTRAASATSGDAPAMAAGALAEARAIHDQDRASCESIGRHGLGMLGDARRLLTHCNTGRLATGGDGTALAIVYAAHAAGRLDEVLVDETRPLLQGARLTAWELARAGVPHRVLVDGAAGLAMVRGMVDAVVVGCDRVAANGDTANKVGTYGLAVLAARHHIPFLVAGPLTSFDPSTPDGAGIVVEERAADEVRGFGGAATTPVGAPVWNPAFDVTPAELITAFVTDAGILRPPFGPAIAIAAGGPGRG
ncbi:MAG: S-methyl-5-thioribose-1-phosphate isomerase [Candidatus Limnocylindrales bacterium]